MLKQCCSFISYRLYRLSFCSNDLLLLKNKKPLGLRLWSFFATHIARQTFPRGPHAGSREIRDVNFGGHFEFKNFEK
jgi:hypothetical protein